MEGGGLCGNSEAPRHYISPWVERPILLSGRLDDPLWEHAPWTDDFVDILGESAPKPHFRTRAKILWGDEFLTIGAEMEEPHVWATKTVHDSVIFQDNDFEVFVDPDGDGQLYGELEINALNTTWDLLLTRPYVAHGAAISGWELAGLRTAVAVDGTLNDPRDVDRGWTVEIAIPWAALSELARRELPPDEGDVWRINFSRVEWEVGVVDERYRKVPNRPEMNWVWSPQGIVDMHRPLRWGTVEFTRDGERRFTGLPPEQRILERAWEAQRSFFLSHLRWAKRREELDIPLPEDLTIEATGTLMEMKLAGWHIDQHFRLWKA